MSAKYGGRALSVAAVMISMLYAGAFAHGSSVRTHVMTDRSAEELARLGGEWRDAALFLSVYTWNVTTPLCVAPSGPAGECGDGLIRFTPAPYQHSSCLDSPFHSWAFSIDEASGRDGMWEAATQREFAVVVTDPDGLQGEGSRAKSNVMLHPRDCPVATLLVSPGNGVQAWSTAVAGPGQARRSAREKSLTAHILSTVSCGLDDGEWAIMRISLAPSAPRPALLYVTGTYDTLHDPEFTEDDQDYESTLSMVSKIVSIEQGRAAQFIIKRSDGARAEARLVNTHDETVRFAAVNTPIVYGNNHGEDVCLCGVNVACYEDDREDVVGTRASVVDVRRPPPYPTSKERGTVASYENTDGNVSQSTVFASTRIKKLLAIIIVVVACFAFAALIILFLRYPQTEAALPSGDAKQNAKDSGIA